MESQESSLIDLILDCRDIEEFAYLKSINRYVFQNDYKYNNNNASFFLKYASFELDCTHDMSRFRHNMELVLNNNISTWLNYINMEVKYNNINHAHNLFIRYINKYLNDLNDLNTIFVHYLQFVYVTGVFKTIDMDNFFKMWKNKLNQLSNSQASIIEINKYQNFFYKVYIKFLKEYLARDEESLLQVFLEWFVHTLSFEYWISTEHDKITQNKENKIIDICKLRSVYRLIIDHLINVKSFVKLRKIYVKYANFEFENKELEIVKFCIEKWKSTIVDQDEWNKLLENNEFANDYQKFEKILKYLNEDLDYENKRMEDTYTQDYAFGFIEDKVEKKDSESFAFNESQIAHFDTMQKYFFDNINTIPYEQSLTFWSNYLRFIENEKNTASFSQVVTLFDIDFSHFSEKTQLVKISIFVQRKYLKYLESINYEGVVEKWAELITKVKENSSLTFKNLWIDYLSFIKSSNLDIYEQTLTDVINNYGKPSLFRSIAEILYKDNSFDMLRKVYGALIIYNPLLTTSWTKLFDLEMLLQDSPRTRELTHKIIDFFSSTQNIEFFDYINQIFKRSIEYETEDGEYAHVRYGLYYLYFQDSISKSTVLTDYVQNWVDYAYWEFKSPTDEQLKLLENEENEEEIEFGISEDNINNARKIFELSLKHFKTQYAKRYQMYQQFLAFETKYGKNESILKALKERKPVNNIFPDDQIKEEDEQVEEANKLDDLFSAVDNWES